MANWFMFSIFYFLIFVFVFFSPFQCRDAKLQGYGDTPYQGRVYRVNRSLWFDCADHNHWKLCDYCSFYKNKPEPTTNPLFSHLPCGGWFDGWGTGNATLYLPFCKSRFVEYKWSYSSRLLQLRYCLWHGVCFHLSSRICRETVCRWLAVEVSSLYSAEVLHSCRIGHLDPGSGHLLPLFVFSI